MRIFFFFVIHLLQGASSLHLSMNQTLVSPGNVFELGFFNPSLNSSRWYIGISYKNITPKTYVWVANRQNPLFDPDGGTLQISGMNIVLRDGSNNTVWSTGINREIVLPVVAELLDSGNFVLRTRTTTSNPDYLWQSFESPTDTLLPGMEFLWDATRPHLNKLLTSWRSQDDPAPGPQYFRFETNGFPIISVWLNNTPIYQSGPWNGNQFIGAPTVFRWTWNSDHISRFSIGTDNNNSNSRLRINFMGILMLDTWNQTRAMWDTSWTINKNDCDFYGVCEPNSYCDLNRKPMCTCVSEDFEMNITAKECTRKRRNLNCGGDEFSKLTNMNIPYTSNANRHEWITETKECQKICLTICECTAFAITYSLEKGKPGCVTWSGDLFDVRSYSDEGQDLYIRLSEKAKSQNKLVIILIVVSISIIIIIIILIIYCLWKRRRQRVERLTIAAAAATSSLAMEGIVSGGIESTIDAPHISYGLVVNAKHSFSNQIGRGGFGIVYKGILDNGQEIAVKKLDKASSQGNTEFLNEVKLIASLQHNNLVRLVGWSINNEEDKVLIYEYLPNGSLDSYIFDDFKRYELDWNTRFEIIMGITRGLAYMQEDSRIRIVHRDLKPANILLDKDMTPKISDFGLARIIKKKENEAITTNSVGTRGYISPEYASEGRFSIKSDTFSYGVMILEIVCGKSNWKFTYLDSPAHLPSCVWTKYREGQWEEIVDPAVLDSSRDKRRQVLRCIEVGLLCVQATAGDRPDMSTVLMMLGNESSDIHQPNPPGFFSEKRPNDPSSSSIYGETSTANQFTTSEIIPR